MKKAPISLTRKDVNVEKEEIVWNGFFKMHKLTLKHRKFDGDWTDPISRELFHRGEASAAVLYDPEHDLIGLVEQFRVGAIDSTFSPWCLEVVAGMLEEGETPESLIVRELEEEAGVTDAKVIPITSYYSTPGGCSELIHLFCATCNLEGRGGVFGLDDENEDIYFHVLPADEVFADMLNSRANNAATLIGLQWLQLNRSRLQAEVKQV